MRCMAGVSLLWLIVMVLNYEPKSRDKSAENNPRVERTIHDHGEHIKPGESSAASFSYPSTLVVADSHSSPGAGDSSSAYVATESKTTVAQGPGEMGQPVRLGEVDAETKRKVDQGWQDHAFNQYVSDLISVNRTLVDQRWVILSNQSVQKLSILCTSYNRVS